MSNNFDKSEAFKSIIKTLNSLVIVEYESEDSHANNILDSTITFTLIQLYEDGNKSFSYIIGNNSNIERALFCLNRLRMLHTYNEHVQHRWQYVSCSLTDMGSAYAQFVINGLDSHHIRSILDVHNPYRLIHRFLFNFCFEIVPPSLALFYIILSSNPSSILLPLCVAWYWLSFFILSGIMHTDTKTRHPFRHWKLNDSKAQFLSFCNQHAIWKYMDSHDLMLMIDRYMFNDETYHKRSLVARNDGPWNEHFYDLKPPL